MLVVAITNDRTGDVRISNYKYEVFVNTTRISSGRILGHRRLDGWKKLLRKVSESNSHETVHDINADSIGRYIEFINEKTKKDLD